MDDATTSPIAPDLQVSVSAVVPAPPDVVYDAVRDVERIGERSPETVSARWLEGAGEAGSRFRGRNRIGLVRWSTVATVTEAERGRRFAFVTSAPSRTTWTYAIEPHPDGALVTESMSKQEPQVAPIRVLQRIAGVTDRRAHLEAGMRTTLERLAAELTATTATA